MGATYYVKNLILDYIWGKQTYTVPNTVYVGLCTACNDNGTVTGEPTIGTYGYARVAVTNNDITTTWGAAAAGIKRNSNGTIQFPQVTTASWGTLTYWFISDAATAGNILWYGALDTSLVSVVGMEPYFDSTLLRLTAT